MVDLERIIAGIDNAETLIKEDPEWAVKVLLETGALEQVGWCTPSMADGPNIGSLLDGKFDDDDVPVFRLRATEETP